VERCNDHQNDSTSHNGQKSSPEVAAAAVNNVISIVYSSPKEKKHGDCSNRIPEISGSLDCNGTKVNGRKVAAETRQKMREDINRNLRPIQSANEHPNVEVLPAETANRNESQIGTGNSRKTRRSRNRSLASRDERLANGERSMAQNQHGGGRKSAGRSRTLSPAALGGRSSLDYHVTTQPEAGRRCESTSRSGAIVHRASHDVDPSVVLSSPARSRRSVDVLPNIHTISVLLHFYHVE